MEKKTVFHEGALASILAPIEAATGLPNEAYISRDYFIHERDTVMADSWAAIGFAADLPEKGYAKPVTFMGLPLLILRDRHGEMKVFHNVCSHRGMILVAEPGPVKTTLTCPYHAWTYDLEGNLRGTPHIGGVGQHKSEKFQCKGKGLREVRSAVWMNMVFINLSGDAVPFEDYVKPVTDRWKPFWGENGLDQLRPSEHGGKLRVEVNCNWKLAIENYCEAYHLPWVHPELNKYSRLEDHYNIMVGDSLAGQGTWVYNLSEVAGTKLPQFPDWQPDKIRQAEYLAFYPNVLIGLQADHAFAMIVEPVSEEKTVEHLRLFYVGDEALGDGFAPSREAVLESWRVVFGEDVFAVEGMQKGRHSPGYAGGHFSPEMDLPTHHFHAWVASRLSGGHGSPYR
ncbi:aromatic ring-hydroxylating oxygenase subunit alpha [Aestuariispira insulae]|uniref:Choline monooxygenase n=1 Tax=Aestuariispira insulae TaxID=1461337 RepID=A0A3D9H5Q5_9PROT|nr:aromatic ring-hydroxylating dioxygenase subunit alpha [Aestuariispira insulae]RED44818.1 choline monooxygenase [Aestuariispira insulae]